MPRSIHFRLYRKHFYFILKLTLFILIVYSTFSGASKQEITNGARIDVALNEKYDGSYIGVSREIAHASVGFGIHKRGPVRRAPVSKILVCRPKRPRRFSLCEFVNEKDENDVDGQRAYISGHNRQVTRVQT